MDKKQITGVGVIALLGTFYFLYTTIKTDKALGDVQENLNNIEGFVGKISESFRKVKEVFDNDDCRTNS